MKDKYKTELLYKSEKYEVLPIKRERIIKSQMPLMYCHFV